MHVNFKADVKENLYKVRRLLVKSMISMMIL